jgi:hypothetical protein
MNSIRQWLDNLEIHNPRIARWLCRVIPTACPFEQDIKFLNRLIFHIPPLCKLNPLYEQVVGLRFRALSCLVDEWGEDVSSYC